MGAAAKERPTSVRDQYERLLKAPKPVMRIDGRVQASNRLYSKHRKTLEQTAHRKPGSDKKGTDHTCDLRVLRLPYSATHEHLRFGSKTYGAKKKAAHNERQREIRSANVGLIKRFASIISTPTEFEVAAVEHKISNSKNIIGAKREQRRINAANAYHAERLRKLNPCYSSKKWDKDRMDQLVFLKRHMKDFSLLDQKSKCAALEPEPSMSEISRARDAWCKRRARTTPEREAKVRLAVERAKHRLVQRDRDLAALASGKTRRLAKMKARLKGEESEDDYDDDDFEMPAGFDFEGPAARPGTTKPKKRFDEGRPGTTIGRGRGGNDVRGDDGFHPDENYGDDGFDSDDYDEPGTVPVRVRTPNTRPVTPLPEPIIDRDFLDRDYDTPYTVGRFPLRQSEPVPVSKAGEARHTVKRDDLKACDAHGKPNLPLEVEVETQRRGDEFTITFLAKVRGGGGAKTTHQGRLPVLCTMDDAMAAHYLERLCERVMGQACVDYNNAKTEAELRDEGALASDLSRYVAFKESFHAPPSFTSPNKYS